MRKKALLSKLLLLLAVMFASSSAFADTVTLQYTGSTTGNFTDEENVAATVNLDANAWSVVTSKGKANAVGYNKDGTIRLYYNASGSNTITVSSLNDATINSITMSFATGYANVSVAVDGNIVTGTNGTYAINSSSFTLGNANTSNAQVRINSVVIDYTASGASTKTKIATIGDDFGTTTLDFNAEGTFSRPTITFADGTVEGTDYEVEWTSSNDDLLYVETDGNYLAGSTKGNVEVTLTVEPYDDDTYEAVSKTFTISIVDPDANDGSVEKPYTVAEAIEAIDTGVGTANVYAKGIVSEIVAAFNSNYGNISFNISADGSTDGSQLEAYRCFKGANKEEFTSADDVQVGDEVVIFGSLTKYNSTYEFGEGCYVYSQVRPVAEQSDATILVENSQVAYGETFTIDASLIQGGDITVTSSNEAVATVNGLVITPAAVGETTITVATAENALYRAGSETFVLSVYAPTGSAQAPTSETIVTTFTDKDLNYADGGMDWEASIDANSFEGSNLSRGVQFGSAKGEFTITGQADNVVKVTLNVSTNGTGNTLGVTVGGKAFTTVDDEDAVETFTMPKANDQTVEFVGEGSGNIVIAVNDGEKSVYFKSITVETAANAPVVTLSASGYASYCCNYPLDFSGNDGSVYRAWYVSDYDLEAGTVEFTEIKGLVKAGEGFFLYGTPGAVCELKYATDDVNDPQLQDNLLTGTLAPTYVVSDESTQNYGLSGGNFVKMSDGVVKANKAFLPVAGNGSDARLGIVFNSGDPSGIENIENGKLKMENSVYNMQGQRVGQSSIFNSQSSILKKGLYIVNGKKVFVNK